jgi:hypothetical protein
LKSTATLGIFSERREKNIEQRWPKISGKLEGNIFFMGKILLTVSLILII